MPGGLNGLARGVIVVTLLAVATTPHVASAAPLQPSLETSAPTKRAPQLQPRTVLFVDGHRVEKTSNLQRVYVPGRKERVGNLAPGRVNIRAVMKYAGANPKADAADADTDVDSEYLLNVNTVLQETRNGKPFYRMWLRSGTNTGYRESTDGVNWKVRDPNSVIILKDVTGVSVVKDPGDKKYYLLGWSKNAGRYVQMVSDDGINFEPTRRFTGVLSTLFGDVVHATWDPTENEMVAIAKQKSAAGLKCAGTKNKTGGRTFGTSTSPAITPAARSWLGPLNRLTADCIDQRSVGETEGTRQPLQLYGLPFQRYGDQYLGFPWLYHITQPAESAKDTGTSDGPVDTQIAATVSVRDFPWTRAVPQKKPNGRMVRPNLIERGKSGEWDAGMIFGQAPLLTINGRSTLYYNGWSKTHRPDLPGRYSRPGIVSWRKDSLVAMRVRTPYQPASLQTTAFRIAPAGKSRQLRVNAVLSPNRAMRVAVLDAKTNKVIKGFGAAASTPIVGDKTSTVVTWKGKRLGDLAGRDIKLVYTWSGGSLYAFNVS